MTLLSEVLATVDQTVGEVSESWGKLVGGCPVYLGHTVLFLSALSVRIGRCHGNRSAVPIQARALRV